VQRARAGETKEQERPAERRCRRLVVAGSGVVGSRPRVDPGACRCPGTHFCSSYGFIRYVGSTRAICGSSIFAEAKNKKEGCFYWSASVARGTGGCARAEART
jgi:hypothetical protein